MSVLNDILAGLFQDPTQQGGGSIYQWLAPQSATAAATNTPLGAPSAPGTPGGTPTPPPAAQNSGGMLSQFFQPHRGLLGNSLAGDAVRGGLAGLGSSTGYTGLAAVGQGAMGAAEAAAHRRQGQMGAALAGQQYQGGQQSLAQGNIGIAQMVARYNVWAQMSGRQPITYQQAMSDPQALAQAMSSMQQPGGQPGAQGQAGPTGQPGATAGMPPVTGGGGNVNPQVAAAYGPQAAATTGTPQQQAPNPQGQPAADPESGFRSTHMGYSTTEWAQYGMRLAANGDASGMQMVKDATAMNPDVLRQTERAKALGQLGIAKPGGAYLDPQSGNVIGQGNPIKTEIMDPSGSGNMVPALQYPDGRVEVTGFSGGNSAPQGGGNNPGNIRPIGSSTGFQSFKSMGEGVDAMDKNLQAYASKGINTVRGIVSTWAPPNQNDTPTLVANAAKRLGVDPDKPLDMSNPNTRAQVTLAIMQQENGGPKLADNSVTGTNAGTQPVAKLGPYAATSQELWAKRKGEIGESVGPNIQAEQRFKSLGDALKATESGAFTTDKANIKAGLHSVGIDLPDNVWGNPAQVQIALKESVQGVFSQIKSLVGGRVAAQEINLLASASANPDLQPAANAKIIAQAIGAIRYDRDYYDALSKEKNPVDPNDFQIQFQKEHPIQEYMDKAEKELGPLKGQESNTPPKGAPSNAEQASDGKWYSSDPARPGKFLLWQ